MKMLNYIKGFFKAVRAFTTAQGGYLFADWRTNFKQLDFDMRTELVTIRSQARDMFLNNPIVIRYHNMLRNNVIGPDGFQLQVKGFDYIPAGTDEQGNKKYSKRLDEAGNSIIEDVFKDWALKENCTVSGDMTLLDVQNLIMDTLSRDGECIIRKVPAGKYKFALQIIPADYLAETKNEPLSTGNFISLGKEYDKAGKVVAYHFRKMDNTQKFMGIYSPNNDTDRIPADQIYHLYHKRFADQGRGYPWAANVMYDLRMLHEYMKAAETNARINATITGFFKQTGPAKFMGDKRDGGNNVIEMKSGQMRMLPDGVEPVQLKSEYPQAQYDSFVKRQLRIVASGLNVDYNMLANDVSEVNYSSIRAGLIETREFYKAIQRSIIDGFLTQLFQDWLKNALLRELIVWPSGRTLPFTVYEKFKNHIWQGRRWAWVDPLKDIQANILAIENGLNTYTNILAEQGKDFEEMIEMRKYEKMKLEEAGLLSQPAPLNIIDEGNNNNAA